MQNNLAVASGCDQYERMSKQCVTGNQLTEGMRVYVEGHPMEVRNPRICVIDGDRRCVRFEGYCTEDPVNDCIRHTGFNGGVYGQLAELTYALV